MNKVTIARPQGPAQMKKAMTMQVNPTGVQPGEPRLPDNLSRWIPKRQLLGLVLDAVQTVEFSAAGAKPDARRRFRPQMMLTLLTYAYAAGIESSEAVLRAIKEDPTVRYICAHHYPEWNEIRLFRRHHREQLLQALQQVYLQAWAARLEEGVASFEGFEWFEDVLRAAITRKVDHKIERAILLDWVNLED